MDNTKIKVAHLTSAHPRFDTRIYVKQCRLLARQGYDVTLVVADGLGSAVDGGVRIVDAGRAHGRLARMVGATRRVLAVARQLDAHLYHVHDPELLPAALLLKRMGKTVIFDAHEDLPLQILAKPYLPAGLRPALAWSAAALERRVAPYLDAIVAATPAIGDKFRRMKVPTVDVHNYPMLSEFAEPAPWLEKSPEVCYIGSIAAVRGIRELVAAMAQVASPVRLNLAGTFDSEQLKQDVRGLAGWTRVNWLGQLDREGVAATLARSLAGLVTLHHAPNYLDALPVKMFEYMAAGIPVIATDIPLWKTIVERHQCGLAVDPLDPAAIAAAIDQLARHPDQARAMGARGRAAIVTHYNWTREAAKLLALYDRLVGQLPATAAGFPQQQAL